MKDDYAKGKIFTASVADDTRFRVSDWVADVGILSEVIELELQRGESNFILVVEKPVDGHLSVLRHLYSVSNHRHAHLLMNW